MGDVHTLGRLSVRLKDSPNGCFMVNHHSDLSLIIKVKSIHHLDKSLIELKESVLGKHNEPLSV